MAMEVDIVPVASRKRRTYHEGVRELRPPRSSNPRVMAHWQQSAVRYAQARNIPRAVIAEPTRPYVMVDRGGGRRVRRYLDATRSRGTPFSRRVQNRLLTRPIFGQLPKFTKDEVDYINSVTNPFGHDERGAINLSAGGRVCDASGGRTIPLTLHCQTTIICLPASVNMKGVAKICYPQSTNDAGIYISRSVAGAASPTANSAVLWENFAAIKSTLIRYRVVGAGLKCFCESSPDNTAGKFQGGNVTSPTIDTGPAYFTYASNQEQMEYETLNALDGITVRWVPMGGNDYDFDEYAALPAAYKETHWRAPCVLWDLAENTVLTIMAVLHLECFVKEGASPYPPTPSPVSTRWELIHALTTHPQFSGTVTKGNSFFSFFTESFKLIPKVAKWLADNAPTYMPFLRALGDLG